MWGFGLSRVYVGVPLFRAQMKGPCKLLKSSGAEDVSGFGRSPEGSVYLYDIHLGLKGAPIQQLLHPAI